MSKKLLVFLSTLILVFMLVGSKEKQDDAKGEIRETISYNMEKILETTSALSSNPYDYIDNEYYENIVALGFDAVPVLEEMYQENELTGLSAYLSALAIQDITGCNLYEDHDLDWSTAEEFYELWEENGCYSNEK